MTTPSDTARRIAPPGLALGGALLGLAALAGAAAPGPAAAQAGGRVLLWSCTPPITIDEPGTYVLARDLICPAPAITITAADVRLSLGGRTLALLDGPPSFGEDGIVARGTPDDPLTGLRITSGTVTGFDTGVLVRNAPGARVTAVTAEGNEFRGIYVGQSPGARIVGNTATDNNEGIYAEDCDGCRIAGNRATGNARGISSDGIQLDSTTGARVEGNTATGNGDDGLDLSFSSTDNLVRGNAVTGNLGSGIDVTDGSRGNRLEGNTATGNDADGNGDRHLFDGNVRPNSTACANTWRGNSFVTDNEGDGPGAGCIR